MKKTGNLAFIIELLLLFVSLLFVIVVITQTFMTSRGQGLYARHLNEAVCLAQAAAEVGLSAEDGARRETLLGAMDQVESAEFRGDEAELFMVFSDKEPDRFRVLLTRSEDPSAGGRYVTETVRVYFGEEKEPIYTLDAGAYQTGGGS